jgi:type II secretory pathway component PulF
MNAGALSVATRQLADLLGGGVTLVRALDIAARQTRDGSLRAAFQTVRRDVASGRALSDALRANGGFAPVYVGLVRAGESAGRLDGALEDAARHLDIDDELRRRARAAAVYPCAVLAVAAAVSVFLVAFVIPRFQLLFADLGRPLPWPTRFLVSLSALARGHAGLALAGAAAVALIGPSSFLPPWRDAVRRLADTGIARRWLAPRFAERWARVMTALLRGGFSMTDALRLARSSLSSHPLSGVLPAIERDVDGGRPLSDALRRSAAFPPLVAELAAAGEEGGRLEDALDRAAAALGRESDAGRAAALALLEPALVLAMAGVVGFIAISLLLPIFDMSAGVR